jgi:hypothetical protein
MKSVFKKYFGESSGRIDRRFNSDKKPRAYKDIGNLWEKHYEMLRLCSLGMTNPQIAETLGVSVYTVKNITESTLGRQHLMVLRGSRDADTVDLMQRIRDFGPKCLDVLEDVIAGKNVGGEKPKLTVRVNAAKDYLNRIPEVSPHSRRDNRTALMTLEDIQNIKRRAMESGIVDVTPQGA